MDINFKMEILTVLSVRNFFFKIVGRPYFMAKWFDIGFVKFNLNHFIPITGVVSRTKLDTNFLKKYAGQYNSLHKYIHYQ